MNICERLDALRKAINRPPTPEVIAEYRRHVAREMARAEARRHPSPQLPLEVSNHA